jgi:DeoR/GlpR family transcriptional regulator of sugar metabolism
VEKICGLRDVDLVVTDSGISDENYNMFSEFVKIIKA